MIRDCCLVQFKILSDSVKVYTSECRISRLTPILLFSLFLKAVHRILRQRARQGHLRAIAGVFRRKLCYVNYLSP